MLDIHVLGLKVYLPNASTPLFEVKDFSIPFGKKILIRGSSGKGKTTFLHILCGILTPNEGSVRIGAFDLFKMGDLEKSQFRKNNCGIIFQRLNLIEHLTALENVLLCLSPKDSTRRDKAKKALQQVDVLEAENKMSKSLSLGEQQRVAVSRVLAQSPSLVFADEPTSSLDDLNTKFVKNALFKSTESKTLIVVSHDQRLYEGFDSIYQFEELIQK